MVQLSKPSNSLTPAPCGKVGRRGIISNFIDFKLRQITLKWWVCATIEAALQDCGLGTLQGEMPGPWSEIVTELGGDPLEKSWMTDAIWVSVISNTATAKASMTFAPPRPMGRARSDPKEYARDGGAEWGAFVQRRYIDMVATQVGLCS